MGRAECYVKYVMHAVSGTSQVQILVLCEVCNACCEWNLSSPDTKSVIIRENIFIFVVKMYTIILMFGGSCQD